MARERGSTGYFTDVQEAGKMAASPPTVQVTASTMKTTKRGKGKQGADGSQRLQLKQEGSGGIGGIGQMTQDHHSTQKGMAVFALKWCYQELRDSSRSDYFFCISDLATCLSTEN